MTILKYLKDRWLLLIGWLFFLFLTCFILWLAPNVRLDWTVVGYIFLLQSVFLSLFLTIDYYLALSSTKGSGITNIISIILQQAQDYDVAKIT